MHSSAGTLFGFNNSSTSAASTSAASIGGTSTTNTFGSTLFGASTTGAPNLTSQPVFGNTLGSTTTTTAATTQATGFGFGSSTGTTGGFFGSSTSKPGGFGFGTSTTATGGLLGASASKPSGFGFGASTSFGVTSTNTTSTQNSYPHLSIASNVTDSKYLQIYDTAFRAACDKGAKGTTLVSDLSPKIQELCANLEKVQTDAINKRNELVKSMITTAPCLKVMDDETSEDAVFSIPDQIDETISHFRRFRQNFSADKANIDKLSATTTELLSEVKRLEQLVNKVKASRSYNLSNNSDQNSTFKRQKSFYQFLSPNLNGFQHDLSRTIASVHPVSKPTDFIEYFIELEKSHESKIQSLNQQLLDIDNKTNSFLQERNRGSLKTKSAEQQYEMSLREAQNQLKLLEIKTQESQARIIELRRLAFEGGIELRPSSSLKNEFETSKNIAQASNPDDPLNSVMFRELNSSSKPGWDDVLYEIASTELVPSDLTKAKPA